MGQLNERKSSSSSFEASRRLDGRTFGPGLLLPTLTDDDEGGYRFGRSEIRVFVGIPRRFKLISDTGRFLPLAGPTRGDCLPVFFCMFCGRPRYGTAPISRSSTGTSAPSSFGRFSHQPSPSGCNLGGRDLDIAFD